MSPTHIRRGMPRVPGGDRWPPGDAVDLEQAPDAEAAPAQSGGSMTLGPEAASTARMRRGLPRRKEGELWPDPRTTETSAQNIAAVGVSLPTAGEDAIIAARALSAEPRTRRYEGRRGLPRAPGGHPWPPGEAHAMPRVANTAVAPSADNASLELPKTEVERDTRPELGTTLSSPLPFRRTVWVGASAASARHPRPEAQRYGRFTRLQWVGASVVAVIGITIAAAMAVAFVRWFLSVHFMQDWLQAYPGESHVPELAPVGLPAWLGWQHFLNSFFMLFIIRTGLQVRNEKRPSAYWSPRWNRGRKISLALWFHQSLDLLWVLNGALFIVLLFVTGQWMRIIPTSWDVFPNALSAALQYVSLDWPTENGWVNYNALQVLTYFTTVFVAAPLAILSGVRMSGLWPTRAATLGRLYPVEWARAVHFPVMLYFMVFIAVHIFLVIATGALRNLNHVYAAQGSADADAYANNWTGFWFFVLSLVVMSAAWVAARPMVLAPIARVFGSVSNR